jgi:hypothetical protein
MFVVYMGIWLLLFTAAENQFLAKPGPELNIRIFA